MFKPWRLGSVLGFPIELNPSFLLLLGVVFVGFGGLLGVLVVAIAFASVLLHELGHAVVARYYHVDIAGIELGFLGGAAKMTSMPRKAKHEIAIAAAGPIVSIALGVFGLAIGAGLGSGLVATVGWINLVLAAFNLIPALPMDGGRILRAALSYRFSYVRATELAIKVARVAAVGFALLGLAGSYQMLILAPFLWLMGSRELVQARLIQDHWGGYPDDPDRELEVMAQGAWARKHGRPQGQHRGFGGAQRRFTIRHVRGRLIIELVD
jgi:Zn-dependent protease